MGLLAKLVPAAFIAVLGLETAAGEINWSSTITLGSLIIGVLLGLASLAVFGYGVKWKTAYEAERATALSLRDGREAYKLRGDRLEGELADARAREVAHVAELLECHTALARLEERPDLNKVLQILGEQSVREDAAAEKRAEKAVERLGELFAAKLDAHDARAAERQEQIIEGLQRLEGRTA